MSQSQLVISNQCWVLSSPDSSLLSCPGPDGLDLFTETNAVNTVNDKNTSQGSTSSFGPSIAPPLSSHQDMAASKLGFTSKADHSAEGSIPLKNGEVTYKILSFTAAAILTEFYDSFMTPRSCSLSYSNCDAKCDGSFDYAM